MKYLLLALSLIFSLVACNTNNPDEEDWITMFNGENLNGWNMKMTNHPLGENFNNTVRVEDGLLKMVYDDYSDFNGEFTHLFYKDKFSYYKLIIEYRFVGEQVTGGPGWAIRNSGAMIHGQSAESMGLDQPFPASIEVQFLGGLDSGERSTSNLCTPITNVEMFGDLFMQHCTSSDSKTYNGDQWVMTETVVYGNEQIWHMVEGDTVLNYQRPQLDPRDPLYESMLQEYGSKMISEGTISLQGESGPVQFRTVKILNLKGCMDPKAQNYKSYYVKEDNSTCKY